jgi:hypothetical protein
MRRFLAIAALTVVAAALVPAHADGSPIVASAGDRNANSFTTPVSVTPVGGPITFLNGDVQPHGLASDDFGPNTRPWCDFFAKDHCPLFWAPVTDAGFRQNVVQGLDGLVSGVRYGFHCTLHPNMKGVLIAL